jgi:hypothetical protein
VIDPVSLAALEPVLGPTIGFLYGQVGELLRRRRDRRAQAAAGAAEPDPAATEPVEVPSAGEAVQVLAGDLVVGPVDEQVLDRHAEQLARLRGLLAPYAEGDLIVDPGDEGLLEQVEAVRRLLEQIYRQHVTFRGEQRPVTGTPIPGRVEEEVGLYASEVIASGERAVAVGRDAHHVSTGDQLLPGERNPGGRPPVR